MGKPHHHPNGGGGGRGGRGTSTKRGHRQIDAGRSCDDGSPFTGDEVDDLAFAATFAVMGPTPAYPLPPSMVAVAPLDGRAGSANERADDNEIEVDSDEDDSDGGGAAGSTTENGKDGDDDDDHIDGGDDGDVDHSDDDDESDVDLAEVLDKMKQADDKEYLLNSSTAPRTENEVDAYKVPIQELEVQMQMQLTVHQEGQGASASVKFDPQQLSVAGRLKNFMVVDRTVVVESIRAAPSSAQTYGSYSAATNNSATGPLDEGSLLVVQVPCRHGETEHADPSNGEGPKTVGSPTKFISLGRILEVFGPVSQPLYTIRLPSPPSKAPLAVKKGKARKPALATKEEIVANSPKHDIKGKETEIASEEVLSTPDDKQSASNGSRSEEDGSSGVVTAIETKDEATSPPPKIESPADPKVDVVVAAAMHQSPSDPIPDEGKADTNAPVEDTTKQGHIQVQPFVDPWAADGEYTTFLTQKNLDVPVYYLQDEAKLIDTGSVMRASGKGCDASNVYDEEVVESNDMYYSDDEVEREAKNKRKGRKSKGEHNTTSRPHQLQHQLGLRGPFNPNNSMPQGFYASSVEGVRRSRPTPWANKPQGFHQTPPPPPPPPPPTYISQTALPTGFHRMPPPPPPPPGIQPYPVAYYPSQYHGQQPPFAASGRSNVYPTMQAAVVQAPGPHPLPPPPPPRNPHEPPAYQY